MEATQRKPLGFFKTTLIVLICLTMIVFMQTTFILIFVGLLPTTVAFIVDRTPSKTLFHTIMPCNLSGVLPFAAQLLVGGNQGSQVQMMLSDIEVLFVMYLSAAFGWALNYFSPYVARAIINFINTRKIKNLQFKQQRLIEEWGAEVRQMHDDT